MISGPRHFATLAGRLHWDPGAFDLTADAAGWAALGDRRRRRLITLLAGFCVAECGVAATLEPFTTAARDRASASVFAAQREDELRHAEFFDRIATHVLGVQGNDSRARLEAARELAPPSIVELFEVRLPQTARALAAGRAELADAVALYHLILEGVVLSAGQRALLDELADGALPAVRSGVQLVERDERWHVGFGLRCLLDAGFAPAQVPALVCEGEAASGAWGPAVPADARQRVAAQHRRRLTAIVGGAAVSSDHAAVGRLG